MSGKPSVKILISCHKDINYPVSDVYVPVQVGAEGKSLLHGMQPDNEGDNISCRNFTFCELTGQYWAWKNLDADYIGQCHYRRYFYFGDQSYPANDHAQIEEDVLSPHSIAKYRLAEDELIYNALRESDGIIAPIWDVSKTSTPVGVKHSVREHMVGYGLVSDEAFDMLLELTKDLKPEYYDDLVNYLNGSVYLGYNCFVLKKDLFNRLCEFEFPILMAFDEKFSYEGLTTTAKRVCGYLGEVLYSVFIARERKNSNVRLVERPLVFFASTPAHYPVIDDATGRADLHIVWRYSDPCAARLAVAADSLIANLEPSRNYRLTIIHEASFSFPEFKRFLTRSPRNIMIDDATSPALSCAEDLDGLSEIDFGVLLPFLFASSDSCLNSENMLWIDGLAIVHSDPYNMFSSKGSEGCAATFGVFLDRELNRPVNKNLAKSYSQSASNNMKLDSSILLLSHSRMCAVGRDEIIRIYRSLEHEFGISVAELIHAAKKAFSDVKDYSGTDRDQLTLPVEYYAVMSCLLVRLGFTAADLNLLFPVLSEEDTRNWACEDIFLEWSSIKESCVISFMPEAEPLTDLVNVFGSSYWRYARQSDAYELLVALATERRPRKPKLKNRLFPPFSRRRRSLGKIRLLLHGGGGQ